MILYGNELINKIRNEFNSVENRIWITVPFIGHWSAVKKIIGSKWIDDESIDMKIITDIRNDTFINIETIQQFLSRCAVRTLPGLHAKIYIVDDSVFITSANLTETAFSKRYEICNHYKLNQDNKIEKVFNDWWAKSKQVKTDWTPSTIKNNQSNNEEDAGNTQGLKKLWDLTKEPIENINDIVPTSENYSFSNPIFTEQMLNENQTNLIRLLLLRNESDEKLIQLLAHYYKRSISWARGRYNTYQKKDIDGGYGLRGTGKYRDGHQGRPDPQLVDLRQRYKDMEV